MGHNEQSICSNTGNRNLKSVLAYVESDGNLGMQLKRDMFGFGGRNNFEKMNLEVSGEYEVHSEKRVKFPTGEEDRKSELVTHNQGFRRHESCLIRAVQQKSRRGKYDVLN